MGGMDEGMKVMQACLAKSGSAGPSDLRNAGGHRYTGVRASGAGWPDGMRL